MIEVHTGRSAGESDPDTMTLFRTYKYLVSSSSSLLLNHLQKLKVPKPKPILLFSLSSNVPDVENVVTYLSSSATESIGCLSSPLPQFPNHAICSIAYLDDKNCVPFRSTIPGKQPIKVGRWLTKSENSSASLNYNVNRLPDFSQNASHWDNTGDAPLLPERLSELVFTRNLGSVIYFSDDSSEGLVRALNHANPLMKVKQLGLVASHTPFVTGTPFTLFYNGEQFSSGAVGVALNNTRGFNVKSVDYPNLIPFSEPMNIQRVDGNLIHVLNDLNPTEILLKAIAANPALQIGKNDSLYLGHSLPSSKTSKVKRVYRILAGGQSRGTLALEADASLKAGDLVQFYVLTAQPPDVRIPSIPGGINFICTGKEDVVSSSLHDNSTSDIEVTENLTIASEDGFLVSEADDSSSFRCTVPGSIAHVILNKKQVMQRKMPQMSEQELRDLIATPGELEWSICIRDAKEAFSVKPRFVDDFQYMVLEVQDTEEQNLIRVFPPAKQFIYDAIGSGGRVLVHCNGGISLSPAFVVMFVMEHYTLTHEDALHLVQNRRYCISPNSGFLTQIKEYESIYRASQVIASQQNVDSKQHTRRKRDEDDDEDEIQRAEERKRALQAQSLGQRTMDQTGGQDILMTD
ncbi:hypothetical protein Clacol_009900 [Clathrus columnatus]|uniref:Protein-tyrosine-phosphatase n=1 Tax=Clathrus columnatus TaxID=1419009 RepID=A0AAV5AP97_9AGAM|nr:hypothetical protein Clacol_009900 [Clathrus columnatus]